MTRFTVSFSEILMPSLRKSREIGLKVNYPKLHLGNDQENQDNQQSLRLLENHNQNFAYFNYGRGYHYFFDLLTFPRAEDGSPSYANDEENRFGSTYPHDNT
jgi:hypothetical protein